MSVSQQDPAERLVRGAESATNRLVKIALENGYTSNSKRAGSMLPLDADEGGSSKLHEATGLLCRIVSQITYWLLTDMVPFENDPDLSTQDETGRAAHEERYIAGAEKASVLAAAFSGTLRAGDDGPPLLVYSHINMSRIKGLLTTSKEILKEAELTPSPTATSATYEALQCIHSWCSDVLAYILTLDPLPEQMKSELDERTVTRVSLIPKNSADRSPLRVRNQGSPLPSHNSIFPLTERRLQLLFRQYDTEGIGWITKQDMQDIWEDSEAAGLPQSKEKLEEVLGKYSVNDGKVTYDEFSIVMFRLFSL